MVEQRTENPCVGGSIPPGPTLEPQSRFLVGVFLWAKVIVHSAPVKKSKMEEERPKKSEELKNNVIGCFGALVIFFIAAMIFISLTSEGNFYQPSEDNLCIEALERSFNEVYRIMPDSLVLNDELNPVAQYSSCKSFENIAYVVNPILQTQLKSNPEITYNFQYVARLDHIGNEEFELKDFLVDSVWLKEVRVRQYDIMDYLEEIEE